MDEVTESGLDTDNVCWSEFSDVLIYIFPIPDGRRTRRGLVNYEGTRQKKRSTGTLLIEKCKGSVCRLIITTVEGEVLRNVPNSLWRLLKLETLVLHSNILSVSFFILYFPDPTCVGQGIRFVLKVYSVERKETLLNPSRTSLSLLWLEVYQRFSTSQDKILFRPSDFFPPFNEKDVKTTTTTTKSLRTVQEILYNF